MDYKYQEHFFKTYQNLLKQSYTKENRILKARKIVRILKKHIHEHRLEPLKQWKALDIGCSVGHMTAYLAPYVYEMTGTDIDTDAVEEAKEHYSNIENLRYIVADSMKLPFEDESFDLVICTQVYEHVPDSVQLMREIARILVRGGVCYFAATQRFVLMEPHYHLPLLSWFPKRISNFYVRVLGRGTEYYENLLSYRNLKKLVKPFRIYDYTIEVIRHPKEYAADIKSSRAVSMVLGLPFIRYVLPGYIWILVKD